MKINGKMDALLILTIVSGLLSVALSSITYYRGKQKETEGEIANQKLVAKTEKIAALQSELLDKANQSRNQSLKIISLQSDLQKASESLLALKNKEITRLRKDSENMVPFVREQLADISEACQDIRRGIWAATIKTSDFSKPFVGAPDIDYLSADELKKKLEEIPLFSLVPVRHIQDRGQHWQEFFLIQGNKIRQSISQIRSLPKFTDTDLLKDLNEIAECKYFQIVDAEEKIERANIYANKIGIRTKYSPDNISIMADPLFVLLSLQKKFEEKYDLQYDFVEHPLKKK